MTDAVKNELDKLNNLVKENKKEVERLEKQNKELKD
jgi:hypothetical protein